MTTRRLVTLGAVLLMAGSAWRPALAQMPDLRSISGRPLPVGELPSGTVVVRVVRQNMGNAAPGLDVTATIRASTGDARTSLVKTAADGRAQFANLPPGSEFQASVTVDGEKLETVRFPVPPQGGVRVVLISGLAAAGAGQPAQAPGMPPHGEAGPAGAGGGPPGQPQTFRMGAPTGRAVPAADLPTGALEIVVQNATGQAQPGQAVRLGEVSLNEGGAGRAVKAHHGVTDGSGIARFTGLATGASVGYAAVTEVQGLRLSTEPFRMPDQGGMRGQIVALQKTSDPSVLQLHPQTKFIVDLREEALAVMVGLFFRNTSQQIFDPGPEGLLIPLPEGAVNTQEIEGGEPLEIVSGKGVRLRSIIPPDSAASFMTTARFGYILPSDGASRMPLIQPMPVALPDPFILVPEKTGLQLEATGLKPLPDDVDGTGDKVKMFTLPPVAAGGTIQLTVTGIPARDRTGRTVAFTLCLLLVGTALAASGFGRRGKAGPGGVGKNELIARREQLFADLVEIERQRKASGGSDGRLGDRRKQLIGELETVYRNLSKVD